MKRSTRRWRALGAIGLLGAASVVAFTSSVSPVSGADPVQQVEDVGVLRLDLSGSGGRITFTPTGATAPTATQAINVTAKCGASMSGPPAPQLVMLASEGDAQGPGVVSHGIGVRQKNTCGSAEGRLSGNEEVTLALGTAFDDEVAVTDAELDIEGKFDATLDIFLDGGATVTRALVSSSDNGPDSGVGDNDRVVVSAGEPSVEPFRAITLRAHSGEVALEGGGDGAYAQYSIAGKVGPIGQSLGTADTILRLVRVHEFADELSCNETLAAIGGTATSAEVTRLDNTGTQDCAGNDDVGVTFEIAANGVFLDKGTIGVESGTPQAVNALVEIVWAPQTAEVPLPAREINFHPDEDPDDFETVQWCESWDPVTETAVHPADARFPGGVLPWCLVDEHIELQGDDQVVQTQRYHGAGDPRWQ
jgi:hypothetical protein